MAPSIVQQSSMVCSAALSESGSVCLMTSLCFRGIEKKGLRHKKLTARHHMMTVNEIDRFAPIACLVLQKCQMCPYSLRLLRGGPLRLSQWKESDGEGDEEQSFPTVLRNRRHEENHVVSILRCRCLRSTRNSRCRPKQASRQSNHLPH